jgi:cytidylate kinase
METNLLIKYMNERVRQTPKTVFDPGPVITISRECGCGGRIFAEKLTYFINKRIDDPAKSWKWVSKEILSLASEELKINRDKIKNLLNSEEKGFLENIVSLFTDKYYVYDAKIKKVIDEVVRNIAVRGKVVIVGRSSETLTADIPRSLRIKLYAPLSWKVGTISERLKISTEEAKKIVMRIDKKRSQFRVANLGKDNDEIAYDIELNCEKFNQDEMVDLILRIAEFKGLI